MTFKTEIEHKYPLGARIRLPKMLFEGTVLGVSQDMNGGISYTVSSWSRMSDAMVRHSVCEQELNGAEVVEPSP